MGFQVFKDTALIDGGIFDFLWISPTRFIFRRRYVARNLNAPSRFIFHRRHLSCRLPASVYPRIYFPLPTVFFNFPLKAGSEYNDNVCIQGWIRNVVLQQQKARKTEGILMTKEKI